MSKKSLYITALLGIVLLSVSIASPALAADPVRNSSGTGNSRGTHGGYGNPDAMGAGTGIPVERNINLDGALQDLLHANIAAVLDLTVGELTARLDAGETLSEIGLSLGFDLDTLSEILAHARVDALAQAVVDGTLTQDQADWLASRGNRVPAGAFGDSLCDGDCTLDGSQLSIAQKTQRKGYRK